MSTSPTRKPRVLIVIENMSYTYDTRVRAIATTLRGAGYEVEVICPRYGGDSSSWVEQGVSVRAYRLPPLPGGFVGHVCEYAYSFLAIAALSSARFARRPFDVIHLCNPPDVLFPVGRLFQALGRRFVFDQHDLWPELFQARYGCDYRLTHKLVHWAERRTLRLADHVLVTSETTRGLAIRRGDLPRERLTVVGNGPDLSTFPAPATEEPGNVVEVGYLGNMNPQDGLEYLLRAAHEIRYVRGRADLRFVCVGNGSAYVGLRRLAADLRLDGIIEFAGRLAPHDALQRIARCHICVQPDPKNPFTDRCSMRKTLEYMALGRPLVAFELEETQQACGDAALYAAHNSYRELASQILRLADDPDLRRSLGAAGHRRVEQGLAWSSSESALLEAYAGLLGEDRERVTV